MNFIKENIQALKKEYGSSGIVYKLISNDLDLKLGTKRSTFRYKTINKIIFLPSGVIRFESYDPDSRTVLVDYSDIFIIEVGDFIINNTTTYLIKEVQNYNDQAYLLKIKSSDIESLEFGSITDNLVLTETANGTI